MPIWVPIFIAGTGALMTGGLVAILYLTQRTMPKRQVVQGSPADFSAPLPVPVAKELDATTDHELSEKRQKEASVTPVSERASTYEIARGRGADAPTELVTDLPPAERGEVLFYQGGFWRVDAIEPAQSRKSDGRLIVSPTADAPLAPRSPNH